MAPNNALKSKKEGTTTVLDSGTVEARGIGTLASGTSSREVVLQEIVEFLNGEAKASIKSESRAFFTVWTFITRLPGPTWADHHPGYLMRGMAYFPLAGSLVGIFVGVFFDVANVTLCLPPVIAAAFSIGSSMWITGCFHEDGLADASDGIGGGWSRSQILRIMTDTRLGTYGCAVLMLYLVTKLQLLAALGPSEWSISFDPNGSTSSSGAGPALLLSHSIARLTAPYLIRTNNYADEGGPKFAFYSFMLQAKYLVTWWRVAFATLTCLVIGAALVGWQLTVVLIVGALVVSHFAGLYADYLLGGVMGDYLGATICVNEIVVLSLLLMQEPFVRLVKEATSGFMASEASDPLVFFMEINEFVVLSRFLAVVIATTLWRRFVGHPSVYMRETAVANQDDGEIHIGIDQKKTADDSEESTEESIRAKTERICQQEDSTFSSRYDAIRIYLDALAKPMGSLGTLEEWGARLGALQKTSQPQVKNVACIIFAADHGIAKSPDDGGEGCSAYPQAVTRAVLVGLQMEVAGASVLAKSNDVGLRVVDVGVAGGGMDGKVIVSSSAKLKEGTRNSCKEPAMTSEEVESMMMIGKLATTDFVKETSADVLCLGEVGIGNTTTSAILLAAVTGDEPETLVDGGATIGREVDQAAVTKKVGIVKKALALYTDPSKVTTSTILARYGGAEIAALVGSILQASELNLPVIVDGFIVTVAALVAALLSPNAVRVMFFATQSTEKGHRVAFEKIMEVAEQNNIPVPASPVLAMELRMGEATGALLAVPLLRSATGVLGDMATLVHILESTQ